MVPGDMIMYVLLSLLGTVLFLSLFGYITYLLKKADVTGAVYTDKLQMWKVGCVLCDGGWVWVLCVLCGGVGVGGTCTRWCDGSVGMLWHVKTPPPHHTHYHHHHLKQHPQHPPPHPPTQHRIMEKREVFPRSTAARLTSR